MRGPDFRKKRRRSSGRPAGRRGKAVRRDLRFEDKRKRLAVSWRKIYSSGGMKKIAVWAAEILIVCMAAVLLTAAFGQRVSVAGDSMSPVLKNGDVVLVNRLVYRFAKPARGDIVVYRQKGDAHYSVKRIVGLPGETVQIENGKVLIDGKEMTQDTELSDIVYAGLAEEPVALESGEYFVIGDNHTASDDSRAPGVGNVKAEDIYGKAWFIAGPWKDLGFI